MLENLKKYHILLASKSPRRRELLKQLRIPFEVISQGGLKEEYPADLPPMEIALHIANVKADAFAKRIIDDELIITADTVVVCDGKVYGKPRDEKEAKKMLSELSGKVHQVVTGVVITTAEQRTSFTVTTDVEFASLADDEIEYYVDNFQPLDKAGAYGIQEWIGCVAVKGMRGSYYNVMGLPVHRLYQELKLF